MVQQLKNIPILPPKAPDLPIAPTDFEQSYFDKLLNSLRLYFNQIDNFSLGVSGVLGGSYIKFPYGAFHSDTTTSLTSGITNTSTTPIPVTSTVGYPSSGALLIGTEIITYTAITSTTFAGTIGRGAYGSTTSAHSSGALVTAVQGTTAATRTPIYLNITDFSSGIALSSSYTSKIKFTYPGLYNLQFSAQLSSAANAADDVTIWLVQNGNDLADTAGVVAVPAIHGGIFGATIAGWNIFVNVNANDTVEFYWTTDSGGSVIMAYPPSTSPVHPASPGMIVTASFVSFI